MSNFATLYSLGRQHGLKIFVTNDQRKILETFFFSKSFSQNVKSLEEADPTWKSRNWTNPFPLAE
jgi:hypothetical protein